MVFEIQKKSFVYNMQVIQTVSRATVYMNYIMFGSLHKEHEIFFMIPLRGKVIYLFSTFFFLLSLVSSYISYYSFYHLYKCFQFWMFRSYLEIYSDFIYIGNSMLLTLSLLCPSKWTDAELLNIFKKFEFLLVLCAIFALSECFRSIESECNAASCPHLELQILATTKNCSLVHF